MVYQAEGEIGEISLPPPSPGRVELGRPPLTLWMKGGLEGKPLILLDQAGQNWGDLHSPPPPGKVELGRPPLPPPPQAR